MLLPKVTNIVSLTSFKPNKSDPSTKSNQLEALRYLENARGCKGVKFEGVAKEEPDVSVRCVEWESEDAHESFKSGASEYNQKIDAATSEILYSCIEYVVYNLKPSVRFEDFYRVWSKGLKAVEACPGCCPIALGRQIEDPRGVVQIQPWMTLEDHLGGFKNRKDLDQIMAPLREAVAEFVDNGWAGMKAYHLLLTAPGQAL